MKIKHLLTKTLLVAAGLLVGQSAWAGDKTVVKYSFDDASSPALTAGSRVSFDYTKTSVITSTAFLNAWNNANGDPGATTMSLGSTDLTEETWTLTFEWAACGGCNSKPDHTTLKAGSTNLFDISGNSNWNTTVTLSYGESGTATIPVPGCDKGKRFKADTGDQLNTTAYWHHFVITGSKAGGVKMTVTNSNSGDAIVTDVVLSETNVNPTSIILEPCCGGAIGIDELSLTYYVEGEVVQNPVANYTAVNGIERTISATCETEGADIYYSLDNSTWTKGESTTVSTTCTLYFKAVKGTSESDVITFDAVAGEAITLNAPTIARSNNTTVTITADQKNLLLSPTATIYYEYGAESGSFTGSKVLTVAADATITAYAEATGYATSATSTRAVALFPTNVEKIENTPAKTAGWSAQTWGTDEKTVSERTYAPLELDGTQWGTNIYLQTSGAWGLRASGNWYINSNTEDSWILMPNMKAGDIIVVNASFVASNLVNATNSKYSFGENFAYEVTADGDVEIALKKIDAITMDYLYGIYAYRAVASVDVTVGTNGNSFASPYAIDCANLPSGVKAYKVSAVADSKATLTEVTEAVAPGTGLILIGAGSHSLPTAVNGNDISATNKLVGVTAAKTVADDEAYGLKDGKFNKLSAETIPAGKAYLPAKAVSASDAPELTIVFGGEATGISEIKTMRNAGNEIFFDLQGRKVAQPAKGLYIQNGRKVILK